MFYIKTRLGKSKIHGIGLFTDQDIKKGNPIYKHNNKLDLQLSKKELESLDIREQETIKKYGYIDKKSKKWRLDYDDIRFTNHSATPNMSLGSSGNIIALKNIKKGEELTQSYKDFEYDFNFEEIKVMVELMAKQEKMVSILYDNYAHKFPSFGLWQRLSDDEKVHAAILKKLYKNTDFFNLEINTKVFEHINIKTSIRKINKLIAKSKSHNLLNALQEAFKLETGLIEQKYFTIFYSDKKEVKEILDRLEQETRKHSDKIYKALIKEKSL